MNLLRLGTWLFLASPMLTMLTLMTLSQVSASDIDVMEIHDSLTNGIRTPLLIAPLRKHLLVIVSSPGSNVLDDGTVAFDQSLDSLSSSALQLTDSAQFFKDKWPSLPHTADFIFLFNTVYELLCTYTRTASEITCFNLEQDAPLMHISMDTYYPSLYYNVVPLYTYEERLLYLLAKTDRGENGFRKVIRYKYLDKALRVPLPTPWDVLICITHQGLIQFQKQNCNDGPMTNWNLTGGFAHDGIFLFEGSTLLVIQVDNSLHLMYNQIPAPCPFTRIPFQYFWRKPLLLPSSVAVSNQTTPAAGNFSQVEGASSSVTQSLTRVTQRTPTTSNGHTLIFIIIGVFFVLLLIGGLAVYLLFKGGPEKDTKPDTGKGDGAGGKACAKSGKQSGGGAVQAKASKLSAKRGASGRSQAKCRRSSVKLQTGSSKCRTSPGKAGPSSQRASPLKVRQSSVNIRRATPAKVDPSSKRASPLKGQQSKVKSRASPGKMATSRLGSTR